jgi:uncharacterized surface protein with fasciclin (FAS1) repeats
MWDIHDLRGCLPEEKQCPTSISGIIEQNSNFSKFKYILELSGLKGIYNASQADFTLLVPSDKSLSNIPEGIFLNMDNATARHIVQSSTLRRRIPIELLEDSPAAYFQTKVPHNPLFITNMNGITYINNSIRIIQSNIEGSNGIIHVIDNLIIPYII